MTPTRPDLEARLLESTERILAWAESTAVASSDFLSEQAPLIAWELVSFGRAYHTAWITLATILLFLALFTFLFSIRIIYKELRNPQGSEELAMIAAMVGGILTIAFLGLGGGCLEGSVEPFFKAWFAPRLYILDYLRNFL